MLTAAASQRGAIHQTSFSDGLQEVQSAAQVLTRPCSSPSAHQAPHAVTEPLLSHRAAGLSKSSLDRISHPLDITARPSGQSHPSATSPSNNEGGRWQLGPSLTHARRGAVAVPLETQVYVCGGWDGRAHTDTVSVTRKEIFGFNGVCVCVCVCVCL